MSAHDCTALIDVLGEKHVLEMLLFLRENGTCNKSQLYSAVSRGARMPDKLDMMEVVGLIVIDSVDGSRCHRISLTDLGRRVSDFLHDLMDGASNRDPAVARRSTAADKRLTGPRPENPFRRSSGRRYHDSRILHIPVVNVCDPCDPGVIFLELLYAIC